MLSPKPQPLVPWMGGKRRLAKHLIPLFPEHQCYVELFAGGAALFFLRPEKAKTEVLNDLNGGLINLYRVVQHHFDEFVRQFEWTLTSREVFARLQATPPESMTDIQRAARFFYLQHTAFGGKVTDQHFGTATTGRGFNAADIAGRLKAAQQRLGGYDRAFDWPQYQQLADMMATAKGKVMLSINDHPDIRKLFGNFRTERLELAYSVGRDKTQKTSGELVICNW